MKIYKCGKLYEVMSGYESLGKFVTMEEAKNFIELNGEFDKVSSRDWKNTSKYDGNYVKHVCNMVEIDKNILEEAYENYYGNSFIGKF